MKYLKQKWEKKHTLLCICYVICQICCNYGPNFTEKFEFYYLKLLSCPIIFSLFSLEQTRTLLLHNTAVESSDTCSTPARAAPRQSMFSPSALPLLEMLNLCFHPSALQVHKTVIAPE